MKYQIRRNIFETNSSSVHVIAISKDRFRKSELPEKIEFLFGEYGWELETYKSIEKRASYLYTAIYEIYDYKEGSITEAKEFIKSTLNELNIEVEFEDPENRKNKHYERYDFYIDHCTDLGEWLYKVLSSRELLLQYLLSPNSFVRTGNDNEDYPIIPRIDDYPEDDYLLLYEKRN